MSDSNIPTHQGVQHPNKIFIFSGEIKSKFFDYILNYVIIVAANSKETAQNYITENKPAVLSEPMWVIGASYQTILTQDGSKPEPIQVKLLSKYTYRKYEKPDSSLNQVTNNGTKD